ncbi:MAG: response regulator [Myxococcaceae bacterium]|nr:response regulator [Myxococcaceae bacterium]
MGKVLGRVLVIDDDAFMLKVIRELLERAGFRVHAQASPSGAAQIIMHERIDAAVIDWNLPGLLGDEVIRLLRTWEEVKDLPVLLITGAPEETLERIRSELPGVRVLGKELLKDQLVSVLGSVLSTNKTVRGLSPVKLGADGEFSVAKPRSANDLVPHLLSQLAETLPLAKSVWLQAAQGRPAEVASLVQSLDVLAGQARLLALDEAASLLQALTETLSALPEERKVAKDVKRAIDGGMEALSALSHGVDGAFTIPPEPVIGALRRARSSFPPARQRQGQG